MEKHLLRQHLLLSNKYQDCEQSWAELGKHTELPQGKAPLNSYLQPEQAISTAAHWYLFAQQTELANKPKISLSLFYPLVLTAFSMLVMAIVSLFVFPEFVAMYLDTNLEFPPLSNFMMLHIENIMSFIFILLLLIVGFSLSINMQLKKAKPINKLTKYLYIFNPWVNLHNRYCAAIKLIAWQKIGVDISEPQLDGFITPQEFLLAKNTHNLLDTFFDAAPTIDPHKNMLMNQRLNTFFTIIIGIVIGAFIIATYIPIFQLGEAF
ncbi:MAG: hypothetical protein GY951_02030 [Psychromonas sp.]|nr:hypothetical protein [Alteromonadales bacterium]MCP5076824.1 hypothetical protein [Psychromonas sp.]